MPLILPFLELGQQGADLDSKPSPNIQVLACGAYGRASASISSGRKKETQTTGVVMNADSTPKVARARAPWSSLIVLVAIGP
jgi:hypothetical protein